MKEGPGDDRANPRWGYYDGTTVEPGRRIEIDFQACGESGSAHRLGHQGDVSEAMVGKARASRSSTLETLPLRPSQFDALPPIDEILGALRHRRHRCQEMIRVGSS